MLKGILIGGILGIVAYFFVFRLLGLDGAVGWVLFFALGIPIIMLANKISRNNK
jgi:hypothetical protein